MLDEGEQTIISTGECCSIADPLDFPLNAENLFLSLKGKGKGANTTCY